MGIFSKQKPVNHVVLLSVSEIAPSPYQPRKVFDPRGIHELAESIQQNGLLQPITVRQIGQSRYELIAGERRLKACQYLQQEKIRAIIEECDDEKSATFALIENLQRKDLNYFEEATGIHQFMKQCSLTQAQAAQQLGKAQSTVANKLRLLNFSQPIREMMLKAGLTERHARALLKLPNEEAVQHAIEYIVKEKFNVGDTEKYVAALLQPTEEEHPKATRLFIVKDLRIFMNTISKAISTMKMAGIEVDAKKEENEQYISYTMKIPKKSACRPNSA